MRKKILMFYIALVAMMLLPLDSFGQDKGFLGHSPSTTSRVEKQGLFNGMRGQGESQGLGTQGFNQMPLSGGMAILVAAGAGYALIKRKRKSH